MAADRMSEKVAYLYQPLNPSILRLVKMTIEGAHKEGKWVGMCGEMAGYEIESESYKGNIYLCDKCFADLQTNIKKVSIKNEKTK